MKYFKDPITNAVFAYEEDGSQDQYISDKLIPISEAQAVEITTSMTYDVDVPARISMRQARLIFHRKNLLTFINQSISSDAEANIEWEYSTTIERNSNLTSYISDILNLSEKEIDQIFLEASVL